MYQWRCGVGEIFPSFLQAVTCRKLVNCTNVQKNTKNHKQLKAPKPYVHRAKAKKNSTPHLKLSPNQRPIKTNGARIHFLAAKATTTKVSVPLNFALAQNKRWWRKNGEKKSYTSNVQECCLLHFY